MFGRPLCVNFFSKSRPRLQPRCVTLVKRFAHEKSPQEDFSHESSSNETSSYPDEASHCWGTSGVSRKVSMLNYYKDNAALFGPVILSRSIERTKRGRVSERLREAWAVPEEENSELLLSSSKPQNLEAYGNLLPPETLESFNSALQTKTMENDGSSSSLAERYSSMPLAPICNCGKVMVRRVTKKEGPNRGRHFFACPQPREQACSNVFQWCDLPLAPRCNCGSFKVRRTVKKEGPNQGRQFYVCPLPPKRACYGSFQWYEEDARLVDMENTGLWEEEEEVETVMWELKSATLNDVIEEDEEVNIEKEIMNGDSNEKLEDLVEEDGDYMDKKIIEKFNIKGPRSDLRPLLTVSCDLTNETRASVCVGPVTSSNILRLPLDKHEGVPSVTRILQATMSDENRARLARWEAAKIKELGLAGFNKLKADTFRRGHTLHKTVETYFETGSLPSVAGIDDPVSKCHVVSFSAAMPRLSCPLLLESAVRHRDLGYCGIVDCVANIDDSLVLIDWKTSEREKNEVRDLYDNPLQLAAYVGALNSDERYEASFGGNITKAAIVVVYNSGLPSVTHVFDKEQMNGYWEKWLERLDMFHQINA